MPAGCPIAQANIQGIAFLGTDGYGIYNDGIGVIRLQPPLVIVQMEHMGLLYAAVYQPDLRGIAHIRFWNEGRRVSVGPGAHGDILVRYAVIGIWIQRQSVPHGLRPIADGGGPGGKPCMGTTGGCPSLFLISSSS